MARPALNTADIKIDQKDAIEDEREPTIVPASEDVLADKDYTERLAVAEEPVTIRLLPSGERNPPLSYLSSVNGKGAEVLVNGQWIEMTWLPVNVTLTTKVKYAAVLCMAKTDNIRTDYGDANVANPHNRIERSTSAVANFELLKASDRATHWLHDQRQRQA
jgi:hypothetical protein